MSQILQVSSYEAARWALTQCYIDALRIYLDSQGVRDAAATVGLDQRAYCDSYVSQRYGGFMWTDSSSAGYQPLDIEACYREALARVAASAPFTPGEGAGR